MDSEFSEPEAAGTFAEAVAGRFRAATVAVEGRFRAAAVSVAAFR